MRIVIGKNVGINTIIFEIFDKFDEFFIIFERGKIFKIA